MTVKITTKEIVGTVSYETIYEFSSYDEFEKFETFKQDQMKLQVSGSLNDLLFGNIGDSFTDDFWPEPSVVDINVKKKDKLH